MADLPACAGDCQTFREAMERYQINDPNNIYNLDSDPKHKEIITTMRTIQRRLLKDPDKNFLINYCLAGHGMHQNGL